MANPNKTATRTQRTDRKPSIDEQAYLNSPVQPELIPDGQMVQLTNGMEALNLVPTLTSGPVALVDLKTLMRLAGMLPKANIDEIIKSFRDQLDELGYNDNITKEAKLREYTRILGEELAFHKTINLITMVEMPEPAMPEAYIVQG